MNTSKIPDNPWLSLSRTISELLSQFPFYGHVLTTLARSMDNHLKFAAAVGIGPKPTLFINPVLFFKEEPKQRMGILIHEIEHVIRLHIPRFQGKVKANPFIKEKANMAMDLAVNSTIQRDLLPSWVLFPEEFNLPERMTAEWYFNSLPDPLGIKVSIGKPENDKTQNDLSPKGRLLRDDFDVKDIESECGGKLPYELEKKIVQDMVRNAVLETEKARGSVPGHIQELIQSFSGEPKIPWNVVFRRLCQWASAREKAYSKKRRSRRYNTRPGPYMKRKLKLTVAFDTSGSISDTELSWFFSELDHLSQKGAQITLIQCDASIQRVESYKRGFRRENPEVYGRGGTAFTPVFDYLLEDRSRIPDLLVYFTDGYGDSPKDPGLFPVCWVYTPNHQKAADFGFHLEYEPPEN